jgi:hypothetical protein
MAKLVKPDRNNREQCIAILWKSLKLEDAVNAGQGIRPTLLADSLQRRRTPQVALGTQAVASHWLDTWVISCWKGSGDPDRTFAKAFAYFYWGREIQIQARQVDGWSVDVRDDHLHELLDWQALAIAAGQEWFAERFAPYLHSICASGGPRTRQMFFAYDEPALLFSLALQRILMTGRWLAEAELAGMGSYGALYASADSPDRFREALVAFCDDRVAECFGYHGIDAVKRRRPSVFESVMDRGSWNRFFPTELWTLQYAFNKVTGKQLSLDAPHPLLHTPLMTTPLPQLVPLFEDDLTATLKQYGRSAFGPSWKPRGIE